MNRRSKGMHHYVNKDESHSLTEQTDHESTTWSRYLSLCMSLGRSLETFVCQPWSVLSYPSLCPVLSFVPSSLFVSDRVFIFLFLLLSLRLFLPPSAFAFCLSAGHCQDNCNWSSKLRSQEDAFLYMRNFSLADICTDRHL